MHLEFLRNWGVRASLTVSVIVDDQLWGMVACHHPTPLRLDCATRSICELIGRNLGLQVGVKKAVEKQQQQELARHLLDELHEDLLTSATCIDARSVARPRLLEILDADGVVIQFGGHSSSLGKTISAEQLRPIIGKLRAQAVRGIASSKILSGLDASAETYAKVASGALYVGLAASSGDYLLFLRGEREEIIRWAGNPDKSVSMDLEGKLHPRTSFAEWYQSLRGRSRPWSDIQLETARDLREQLIDVRDLHISALAVEIEDGAAKVRE
jgi:light-regulated signal transduction histidine kinase (bacteriophytochrome)